MGEYKFTKNWFRKDLLDKIFPEKFIDEFHILEIGSFEGCSTISFIEKFLSNDNSSISCIDPWTSYSQNTNSFESYNNQNSEWNFTKTKEVFLQNIVNSKSSNKVNILQGLSSEILPEMLCRKKQFDLIFIDGNHTSPFVLSDSVMSWFLLKKNGFIIFDDYTWRKHLKPTLRPQLAIDSFLINFEDYIEIIHKGDWVVIKKK